MPKLNTTVKSVRIDNDKLEELEQRLGGKTINAWLNERIEDYIKPCTAENVEKTGKPSKSEKILGASPNKYEIDEKILDDLATMQMFMGGSVAEMIRLFDEAVNEGVIAYENGRYVGVPDVDLESFYEVCHERGVEPQEAIDKLVLDMRKGK